MTVDINVNKIEEQLKRIISEIGDKKRQLTTTCQNLEKLQEELSDVLVSLSCSIEDLDSGIENLTTGISEINDGIDSLAEVS